MELNEKLIELRKQKGLTQEELAQFLYVSRTAVSKWESGRGIPNIDSLKAIARFYTISLDDLLSSDALLGIAEHDQMLQEQHYKDLVFGLLDVSMLMLFILPFFRQTSIEGLQSVSLLTLTEVSGYLRFSFIGFVICQAFIGIATLTLQNSENVCWNNYKSNCSLLANIAIVILFLISTQPYAAIYAFVLLLIKGCLLIKKQ